MSDAFVPFGVKAGPAAKSAEPFRAKIVSAQNAEAVAFKAAQLPQPTSAPHAASHGQPQVSVIRDGNKVTAIRVICGCGEVMELTCAY